MTYNECLDAFGLIATLFPSYSVKDLDGMLEEMQTFFGTLSYKEVSDGIRYWAKTSESAFAPTFGQIFGAVLDIRESELTPPAEAWTAVREAIRGCVEDEWLLLPDDIQEIVTEQQLRDWASTDNLNLNIIKTQFMQELHEHRALLRRRAALK